MYTLRSFKNAEGQYRIMGEDRIRDDMIEFRHKFGECDFGDLANDSTSSVSADISLCIVRLLDHHFDIGHLPEESNDELQLYVVGRTTQEGIWFH